MATTFERQLRVAQERTEQTSRLISWHLASVSPGWNPDDILDGRYTAQLAGEMTLFEECVRVVGKTNSRLDGSGKPPGCITCVCVSVLKLFRFYFQNIPNILGRNSILASAAYGNYTFSNLNKH